MVAIDETIKLLEPVYGENWLDNVPEWALDASELGLTDSTRMVLQSKPDQPLSPTEVRDLLITGNYDFGEQQNPMAAVHTVLKRITNGSDPRFARIEGDRGMLYKFDSNIPPPYRVEVEVRRAQELMRAASKRPNKLINPDKK